MFYVAVTAIQIANMSTGYSQFLLFSKAKRLLHETGLGLEMEKNRDESIEGEQN